MKIRVTHPPDPEIFCHQKKYALWFAFFMAWVVVAVSLGLFSFYFATGQTSNLDDWALGILVAASLGITWSGNHLQAYKRLYPPQLKKLTEIREDHPPIDNYCMAAETLGRRLIRAEFEALVEYAEKHSAPPFL